MQPDCAAEQACLAQSMEARLEVREWLEFTRIQNNRTRYV
jgi:hypothetical protein